MTLTQSSEFFQIGPSLKSEAPKNKDSFFCWLWRSKLSWASRKYILPTIWGSSIVGPALVEPPDESPTHQYLDFFLKNFFVGHFKSLYWTYYNTASVLCFQFLAERYVGFLAPWPGMEPTPPALVGKVLTTASQESPQEYCFKPLNLWWPITQQSKSNVGGRLDPL